MKRTGEAGPDAKNRMKIEVTVPEISRVENRGSHQFAHRGKQFFAIISNRIFGFSVHFLRKPLIRSPPKFAGTFLTQLSKFRMQRFLISAPKRKL